MLRAGLAAANRNGEPVTMPVLHQVKVLTAAGLPSRLIATLVGRSKGSIDTIRARYGLKLPALNHHMALKVTDKCRDILQAAACRHKLMPATIARSCLELIVRDRTEAAHAIVAARPVQIAPGELRGIVGLQPSLQARM